MIKNLAIALLLLISAAFARAQDYPKRPINLVIPLAPGDATDTSARAVADELSRELNVPIVAVNRPGAGIVMVPFAGASPALTAMRGGHIEGVLLALGTMTGQLRSGAVRGIVISSKYPDFPEIPTLAELGYAQPLFDIWAAFFAPAGVPTEVTGALVPALERAIKAPGIAARLRPLGMLLDYAPPDKLLADMREEHRRVSEIARQAGLVR